MNEKELEESPEVKKSMGRMAHLLPNFLIPLIGEPPKDVCSVGCGMGFDIAMLVDRGYNAWGLDPGPRADVWKLHSDEVQARLRRGCPQEVGFQQHQFDFVYALEVLEHVGCRNGGTELESDWWNQRVDFLRTCLDLLRPGGRLFLTTVNRNFPADIKHVHRYSRLQKATRYFVNPWCDRNFLPSLDQVKKMLREVDRPVKAVRQLPPRNFASNSGLAASPGLSFIINGTLEVLSHPPLLTFNPILLILIELAGEPAVVSNQ